MKRFMLALMMALLMVVSFGYDQPIISSTLVGATDDGGSGDDGEDHPWGGDQSGGGNTSTTDGTTQAAWMRRTSSGNLFLDWTYWYMYRNPQTVYRWVGDRGLQQSRNAGNSTPVGPQLPQTQTGRR